MAVFEYWRGKLPSEHLLAGRFLPPGATMFAVGGIVEGNHNPFSDIDLICVTRTQVEVKDFIKSGVTPLILQLGDGIDVSGRSLMGEELRDAGPSVIGLPVFATHDYVDDFGTRCDVEYIPLSHLLDIRDRIKSAFSTCIGRYGRVPMDISPIEGRLIHRIFNRSLLRGTDMLKEAFDGELNDMFCYVLAKHHISDYATFQDIIGALMGEQTEMAFELARRFLIGNAMAYLNVSGSSSLAEKWLAPTIKRWKKRLDGRTVEIICDCLWGAIRSADLKDSVIYLLDASDNTVRQMTLTAARNPLFPAPRETLMQIASRISAMKRSDPHAVLSFEYYRKLCSMEPTIAFREFRDYPQGIPLGASSFASEALGSEV